MEKSLGKGGELSLLPFPALEIDLGGRKCAPKKLRVCSASPSCCPFPAQVPGSGIFLQGWHRGDKGTEGTGAGGLWDAQGSPGSNLGQPHSPFPAWQHTSDKWEGCKPLRAADLNENF